MKKKLLRLLPVAAVLLTASCTDDQYDLSEIDTTSQFTVKGLVVPLNMSPIMLDDIISIEKDGDIQKDGNGNYFFQKESKEPFKSKDVKVEKITITKPADISHVVTLEITLSNTIQNNWNQYASDKSISEILGNDGLKGQVGIDANTEVFTVSINDAKSFNLNSTGIDEHVISLKKLVIDPVDLDIDIKMDGIKNLVDEVKIEGLTIDLPCGLTVSNNSNYSASTGKLSYAEPISVINGQKNIKLTVSELNYDAMQGDGASFNATAHTFTYNKTCNVSGTSTIKIGDLKGSVKLNDIISVGTTYSCGVGFSNNIVVNKFSGGINYTIDDIDIEPVKIENLPETLQETGTSIEIANPQLYLTIDNPFKQNNITAQAGLSITGNSTFPKNPLPLVLDKRSNKKVLSPENKNLKYNSYTWQAFSDLGKILSGEKIPETLKIEVANPILNANDVTDFELGIDHTGITGTWEFYTNLSLTGDSKIKYTKVWDDWGSNDLNGLTVENATVTFNVKKDVALVADNLEFFLMGKDVKDGKTDKSLHGQTSLTQDETELNIPMTGGPIKNIYGGRLVVNLKGKGKNINTTQKIEISNLRMKVDGCYEKEF